MNKTKTSASVLLCAFFASVIALLIVAMVLPIKIAYADDEEVQVVASWEIGSPTPSNVVATLYDNGALVIAGSGDTKNYSSTSKPAWHESYRLNIQTVVFEDSVTPDNLSYYFYQCNNLSAVNSIPNSVTNISYAFQSCSSLVTAPEIPNSVTNMAYAFQSCSSLTNVPNLPLELTNLTSTFANCYSLTSVPDIPEGTVLMGNTFSRCTALKSPSNIPSSVTNLNNAFTRCTGLTIIPKGWNIPDGLAANRVMYTLAIKEGLDVPYGHNNKLKTYCDPSDYERLSTDPRLTWDSWNRELISGYSDDQEGAAE